MTSQAGTGQWQEYIFRVRCGTDGSFSSTNFYYLTGGNIPTSSAPVVWQVGYAGVIDTTAWGTTNYIYTSGTDSTTGITAYGYNQSSTSQPSWSTMAANKNVGKVYGPITTQGTYYVWYKNASGNMKNKAVTTKIDRTAPTIGGASAIASSATSFKLTVSSAADTGGSGLRGYYCSTSSATPTISSSWTANTASSFTINNAATNATYYIWVIDNAGNISAAKSVTTTVLNYSVNNTAWYPWLSNAVSGAANGSTIYPLYNVTDTSGVTVPAGKNLTLNLNGKTLTRGATEIYTNAQLTIAGTGTITGSNIIIEGTTATSKIVVTSGTIYSTAAHAIKMTSGTVEVKGGILKSDVASNSTLCNMGNTTISGGTITSTNNNAISTYNGRLTITAGTITGAKYGIGSNNSKGTGTISISGGSITGTQHALVNAGYCDISGGVFNSTTDACVQNGSANNRVGRMWITGGTIISKEVGLQNCSDQTWPTTEAGKLNGHWCTATKNSKAICSIHVQGATSITATSYAVLNQSGVSIGGVHFPKAYSGTVKSTGNYALRNSGGNYIVMNGGKLVANKGTSYYSSGTVAIGSGVTKSTK